MDRLTALFHSYTGRDAEKCVALSPSGSRRRYFRLSAGDVSLIGVHGTDLDENRAFIALSGHFRSKGLRVPEVLAVSDDGMYYLQQDLGDVLLYDTLADARRTGDYGPAERALLLRAVSELPAIQVEGARGLDFSVCYPSDAFNARMVDFDLNYFKYCFLKPTSVEFNEEMLQDDFERLKEDLLQDVPDAFMYRDFQARNIMLHDGELWYIDFQGGRRGPLEYDLASFAWQARARYPEDLRRALVDTYMDALGKYMSVDKEAFRERLRTFVLFRTLQVLGAYGFRGRIEKRSHFLESIPYALENLRELVSTPFSKFG